MNEIVKIEKKILIELIANKLELTELKYEGVDNWEGYEGGRQEFIDDLYNSYSIDHFPKEHLSYDTIAEEIINYYIVQEE